jgi:polyisoprenoid-binding protein YceI
LAALRAGTTAGVSAGVEKAGDSKLKVAGAPTIHGMTKPAALDVTVKQRGDHPMAKKPASGCDAATAAKRSNVGMPTMCRTRATK